MMEVFSVVPLSSLSDLPSGAVAGFRLMVPMSVVILPGIVVVAREQCPCSLGQDRYRYTRSLWRSQRAMMEPE